MEDDELERKIKETPLWIKVAWALILIALIGWLVN
jgi:hypothetical protein